VLRLTAEMLGVSMNELAEQAIRHELELIATGLEKKLQRAVELLKAYRGDGIDADVESFARAEVTNDDPMHARHVAAEDAYGIGAMFVRSVE
jgi:hypothetical protein